MQVKEEHRREEGRRKKERERVKEYMEGQMKEGSEKCREGGT